MRSREGCLVAALLAALSSLPLLLERARGLVHAGADIGSFHIPFAEWWWSRPRLVGGWNPWVFGGYPAHADPQIAGTHPFDGLALVLRAPDAFAIEAAIAPALAGLGMWVYVGGLGAGPPARLVSALCYALGGFVAAHAAYHPGIVRAAMALPWVLAAVDACSGARLLLALAAGSAAILVAGHPQASLIAFGIVVLYTIMCGRLREPGRSAALLGGLAAGAGLAAPLWLPLAELVAHSTRALGVPPDPDLRLEAFDFYQLFAPLAGGGGVGPLSAPAPGRTRCGLIECATYPGMAVWLVVLSSFPALLRDRRARFWIALALASLLGGSGAFGWIVDLPILRGPARALLGWSLAAAVLGGMALAASTAGRARRRPAGLRAAIAIGAVIAWLAIRHPSARAAALGAAVALAASALAWLAPRSPLRAGWLVAAVLAADLGSFRLSLPGVGIAPAAYEQARRSLAPLAASMRRTASSELDRALVLPWPVAGNHAGATRVQLVQGYDPIVLRRRAELLGMTLGYDALGFVNDAGLAEPANHALDLLRVRIVAAPSQAPLSLADALRTRPERFEPSAARGDPHTLIFRNRRAHPVAWLVGRVREVAPGSAIALLRDDSALGGFDPTREVLVEGRPVEAPDPECWRTADPAASSVSVVDYGEDRLRLQTASPCAGVLATSELAYPGWEATLDGSPTRLQVVNGAFRGALVPAGRHEVELRYRPTLPWIARGISGASLVTVLLCAALGWARRS